MKDYYLGLDMGTNSVGWAVTDLSYELIRKKGKDMWGIREFEEAETSVNRRTNRVARRRRQKEVVRNGILRSYFTDEIEKIDPYFFIRLDNSKYHLEDKDENVRYKYGIFNDDSFTDKDYYSKYPTVYHLRKELIENKEPHDVRLVYLAIANMFKHRGHFLNEGLSYDGQSNFQVLYDSFQEWTSEIAVDIDSDSMLAFPTIEARRIEDVLADNSISRSEKAEKISGILKIDKKNRCAYEYIKCICGLKVDALKLFPMLESEGKIEICFKDFGYEEKIPEIMQAVGDDNYRLVEVMKQMHDSGILSGILKGGKYLSVSRVDEYNKHKEDLKLLKKVIKKYKGKEIYDDMFRKSLAGSYSAYVNSVNSDNMKQRREMKNRTSDDLYSKIKSLLADIKDDEEVCFILSEIAKETFLPKQLTSANGVIPNQIHKNEMSVILSNAERYLPFLKEKDESGLSVSERILALFSFHVPYYIGPVTEESAKHGGNGWVVRKETGQVLPWNFSQKIDEGKTSEQFIMRMVRNCSYLRGEKVLPKSSLLYERYCVLNEINNIRIDGERIDVEVKQAIYVDLFEKGKKVTRKQLEKYLYTKGVLQSSEQLTGIDNNINNSLSTYGKFLPIFGEEIKKDSVKQMIERIVFLSTVYGDAKSLLKDKIEKEYGNVLDENQIKRILGYKFKDWGRLSKEFLELQGTSKNTGELMSLSHALWECNMNMIELINSDEFTFEDELEQKAAVQVKTLQEFTYEDLDEYYFSAPVKRMMWQTLLLIKEIKEIMGSEPTKIFIEMTRSEQEKGDKGRKDSRKKQLLELYKNIKDEQQEWKKLIEESDSNGKLRSKKMYLYLTQMGRDMYTGEPIDLDKLFDDNIYDIDHIYPRSFVKDDNINNNLVLVYKPLNSKKTNEYPIDPKIASNPKVKALWEMLHSKKLINDEKYNRLTSRQPFSEEQLAGFIARQIVETSQATKGIADILKGVCPNSFLVYSKAGNVSDFRRDFDLLKSRLVNEFHHANDAYLNIVVGNVYDVKFTSNPLNFIKKEYSRDSKKYSYHMGKMFSKDVVRGDKIGWIAPKEGNLGTIETVKRVMSRNTPLMTRMNFEGHGAISNATLYSAKTATYDAYIPLKSSDIKLNDVKKYGGFTSASTAYFALVESDYKNNKIRTLEAIPIYMQNEIQKNPKALIDFCERKLGLVNPRVVFEKVKMQSLLKINGYYTYISGKTNNQVSLRNAVNLSVNYESINYIHDLETSVSTKSTHRNITIDKNIALYDELSQKHLATILRKRPNPVGEKLKQGREKFIKLSLDDQISVLMQILNLSIIGVTFADLSRIGGAAKSGVMLTSKKISDNFEFKLINQSITGIYEKEVDLLKI